MNFTQQIFCMPCFICTKPELLNQIRIQVQVCSCSPSLAYESHHITSALVAEGTGLLITSTNNFPIGGSYTSSICYEDDRSQSLQTKRLVNTKIYFLPAQVPSHFPSHLSSAPPPPLLLPPHTTSLLAYTDISTSRPRPPGS